MDRWNRRAKGDLYTPEQIKRVLSSSGVDVFSDVGDNVIIFCPFHNNHRTPAGEVHKESGLFFCFSCQKTADLHELVMHITGRSYFEASRFINSKKTEQNIELEIQKQLHAKPEFTLFDELVLARLYNQLLTSARAKAYLSSRKLDPESWVKFSLGYSEKQDMVTVPVHSPDGLPLGFVGRSIEGKEFKNTPGLPKAKTLFNLHRVKTADRVLVVESSFDAIRLDQVGISAVATLGANVSRIQIELLQKYFNNITIVADNDEAGGNMKDRIIEKLGSRVSIITLEKQYKDVGDMTDEELRGLELQFDKTIESMLN